jgi:hypothetical protein
MLYNSCTLLLQCPCSLLNSSLLLSLPGHVWKAVCRPSRLLHIAAVDRRACCISRLLQIHLRLLSQQNSTNGEKRQGRTAAVIAGSTLAAHAAVSCRHAG